MKFNYLILVLFVACATWRASDGEKYAGLLEKGDFEAASAFVESSKLKSETQNQLLYLFEQGTIADRLDQTDLAIEKFSEALGLIDELYTKKLSKKLESLIINDSKDVYYGSHFERSFAHYYLIKSYLKQFEKTGEKSSLDKARAVVLAWDSYFNEVNRDSNFSTSYKTDLMLKIIGAQVHELMQVRSEDQIALQLYKDALLMLGEDKIYADLLETNDLKNFVSDQILLLTQKLRPTEMVQTEKKLSRKLQDVKPGRNSILIYEKGFVPRKLAKKFSIGLKGAASLVKDEKAQKAIMTVGAEVLAQFALANLGFGFNQPVAPGTYIVTRDALRVVAQELAIEFELPVIEAPKLENKLIIDIENSKTKKSSQSEFILVASAGKLNQVVLDEEAGARYLRTGVRVLTHHLVAIAASYQIYQTIMKQTNNNTFLAKAAALTTYLAASKGLSFIEQADLRQWMSLASGFYITRVDLEQGEFVVKLSDKPLKTLAKVDQRLKVFFIN